MKLIHISALIALSLTWGYGLPPQVSPAPKNVPSSKNATPLVPFAPTGTLLKPAPKYAKWQIHFTYVSSSASSPTPSKTKPTVTPTPTATPDPSAKSLPRDLFVTYTQPLWQASLVDAGGRKTETWFDGRSVFLILPDVSQPTPIANDTLDDGIPPLLNYRKKRPDFPDLDWISPDTYTGMMSVSKKACMVFKKAGIAPMIVWIDAQTRYPVRWRKGDETRDFTFMDTPASPLTLPDPIKIMAKAMEQVRENDDKKPPRGG